MNPMIEIQMTKYAKGWDQFNFELYRRIRYLKGWDKFNYNLFRRIKKEKALTLSLSIKSGVQVLAQKGNYKRPQYINQ